eukprot:6886596-Pyramimonas_sp.AAC.1
METQAINITEVGKAMHAQKVKVAKAIAHAMNVALSPGSSEEQRTANLLTLQHRDSDRPGDDGSAEDQGPPARQRQREDGQRRGDRNKVRFPQQDCAAHPA